MEHTLHTNATTTLGQEKPGPETLYDKCSFLYAKTLNDALCQLYSQRNGNQDVLLRALFPKDLYASALINQSPVHRA